MATPLVSGVPGSPGHLLHSERNPNGESELSALMRTMQQELTAVRSAIIQGQGPAVGQMRARYSKIRCAWPTDPSDRNQQFDVGARAYLDAVADLESVAPAGVAKAYDRVLNACRSCHEQSCTGAIVAIEALRLAAAATSP